ncbi:MAG: sn-glycerol-3-phosphate ABC transporter ATP-binding protein UgpC [Tissierellia bacterium]|nr:sn-glycerol-3-phosphate ABC transporter ATP-binding protein UgpC [Tissierellia bacterium]
MSSLSFENVKKVYDNGHLAVKDFNLEIEDGEFIVFVGPSGCGKSTTLRMLAGLEEITDGIIKIDEKIVNDVEPKDRNIAMVFQNYALYPHMNVYNNMAYALKNQKMDKKLIDKKIKEAAKLLEIDQYLDRKPSKLSGGQKQRVALGRAIVRNPKVFLMDEPLSNLDAKLRLQMRTEINRLHKELKSTIIYVTHDQTEAMTLGDRIVVLKDGIIQQVDTPTNLYNNPKNKFVAGFIGSPQINFINASVKDDKLYVDKNIVDISNYKNLKNYNNKDITIGIRAEDISFEDEFENGFSLNAKISIIESLGSEDIVYTEFNGQEIILRDFKNRNFKIGDVHKIYLNANKMKFFDNETKEVI